MDRAEALHLSRVASQQADDFSRVLAEDADVGVKAIVCAIDGLRLAVVATTADDVTVEEADPGAWMRLELFGHQVAYGLVRDVVKYGRRWLEVTQPAIEEYIPEQTAAEMVDAPRTPRVFVEATKLFHPNAVYASEVVTEERVLLATYHCNGLRTPEEIKTGRRHDDPEF